MNTLAFLLGASVASGVYVWVLASVTTLAENLAATWGAGTRLDCEYVGIYASGTLVLVSVLSYVGWILTTTTL